MKRKDRQEEGFKKEVKKAQICEKKGKEGMKTP